MKTGVSLEVNYRLQAVVGSLLALGSKFRENSSQGRETIVGLSKWKEREVFCLPSKLLIKALLALY